MLKDGNVTRSGLGTVQGGSISPLLANIYLHYAFDLWVEHWRARQARGNMIAVRYADRPHTFDFLGFTHCCGSTRKGKFVVLRLTSAKRMRAKVMAINTAWRKRLHRPIAEQGQTLRAVVAGPTRYFAVPCNGARVQAFRLQAGRLRHRTLFRRSQAKHMSWERMHKIVARWLPPDRISHP